MKKQEKKAGSMTWSFIWRYIVYYFILSLIFGFIQMLLLGKITVLVSTIYSIVSLIVEIFVALKLTLNDIFRDSKLRQDATNQAEHDFIRNIIIFLMVLFILNSFYNVLTYSVREVGLDRQVNETTNTINSSTSMTDEQKTNTINNQTEYINQVKKVEKGTYITISLIDFVAFVALAITFRYWTKRFNKEEE